MSLPTLFKYVPHSAIPTYLRLGWLPSDALHNTHHAVHAILMEWLCDCPARTPK